MDGHIRHDISRRQVVLFSAMSLVLLVVAGSLGLWAVYDRLNSNIRSVDIGNIPRNVKDGPLNILLIGSDDRSGPNAEYGQAGGARSDTVMLLHVAADRHSAVVASIARDTMVNVPSCTLPNGTSSMAYFGMFNSAYTTGGAACTVKTVEDLTDIPVDHLMVVDFTGFKNMIDAIGGVPVTLDQAVNDPDSHLNLPAGRTVLNGEQALAFVRARHAFGDGSDLGRMGRQQQFVQATLDTMTGDGTLADPSKLYKVLDAATKAITTDPPLASLSALMALASDIKRVPRTQVQYLTAPWQWYGPDPNRVEFSPKAQELFDALRNDQPVPADVIAEVNAEKGKE